MDIQTAQDGPSVVRLRLLPDDAGRTTIDGAGLDGLRRALDRVEGDPRCRALVVEGHDGVFCQGMDLDHMLGEPPRELARLTGQFADLLARLSRGKPVVVSVVDGEATGGGVGLAAAADLVVATSRARFSLPELVLGLVPAIVLPVLAFRMPPQKTRALALGESIDGKRAYQLGLADHLVDDPDRLDRKVNALIKRSLRLSPRALASLRDASRQLGSVELERALLCGARRTAAMLADPAVFEPIAAYLDGEPLPWFARHRSRNNS